MAIRESYYDVPKKIMSAEVENNKEEEKKEELPKKPLRLKILDQWQIGFKILELVSVKIYFFNELDFNTL